MTLSSSQNITDWINFNSYLTINKLIYCAKIQTLSSNSSIFSYLIPIAFSSNFNVKNNVHCKKFYEFVPKIFDIEKKN